jgi:hypothetical protein
MPLRIYHLLHPIFPQNRDYKYFRHVLNFLRTPAYKFGRDYVWFLKDQQPDEYWRIADEFDYFGIPWSPDERLPNLMEDAVSRPVGTAGEAATAIACTTVSLRLCCSRMNRR